ncbi:hypothetical protein Lalb_Chr03g0032101 [Lupinus albus]|uniref:Late nodulin n=1 Tax=Lupinus albus TaxID=3870 RepID=A0A6A4QQV3_LUPAL|nr:hypothetical protein Lalb_Chr03g0032101 [Lupinus albus]
MEKASFKLAFLVFLLTIAVCHGIHCSRDVDCAFFGKILCKGRRGLLVCYNEKCICIGRNNEKQLLDSQHDTPLS